VWLIRDYKTTAKIFYLVQFLLVKFVVQREKPYEKYLNFYLIQNTAKMISPITLLIMINILSQFTLFISMFYSLFYSLFICF